MRRSYDAGDFPAGRVSATKRGRRVTVCIPARNEAETVGTIVSRIRRDLMEATPVVDEILVVDDRSTDDTAAVAAAAGAVVHSSVSVLPEFSAGGKGQAMWKGVHVATGDVIVFCDADVRGFDPAFVLGLAGPLLARDDTAFVKGFYERPVDGQYGAGGRVTELMARPLISVLFPHLSDLAQPLSGECASYRHVLETIPFIGGYGVDLGLLIDVTDRYGNAGLVQSDLGERVHRNRPLAELAPQSLAVLQAALARAGLAEDELPWTTQLMRPGLEPTPVEFVELPPLVEVPAHRMTA